MDNATLAQMQSNERMRDFQRRAEAHRLLQLVEEAKAMNDSRRKESAKLVQSWLSKN